MLDKLALEQKIQAFKTDKPEYMQYDDEQILSVMVKCGYITEEELREISVLYTPKEGNIDILELHKEEDSNTGAVLGTIGTLLTAGLALKFGKKAGIFSKLKNLFKKPAVVTTQQPFAQIESKINSLPKDLRRTTRNYIKTIEMNEYNYAALDRIIADKNLHKSGTVTMFTEVKTPGQLEMFDYLAKHYSKNNINYQMFSSVLRHTKTKEDFILRSSILNKALKNPETYASNYLEEITCEAKSLSEAENMFSFCKKYGIKPSDAASWEKLYGQNIKNKMLNDMAEIREKYMFEFDHLESTMHIGDSSEAFINMTSHQGITLTFDKATGKLLSLGDNNMKINFETKQIINSIDSTVKESKGYRPGMVPEVLQRGETVVSTEEGTTLLHTAYKKSKLKGEFEIIEVAPNGKKYKVGLAEFDKKGGRHVEKSFTSLDGSRTDFVFADDKLGNRFLYRKITDSQGNILFETRKKFKVLSDNHFITTTNNQSYDILFTDSKVTITKLDSNGNKTAEIVEYTIKDYTKADYEALDKLSKEVQASEKYREASKNHELRFGDLACERGLVESYTVDRRLINSLKQVSGEEWFAIKKMDMKCIMGSLEKDNASSHTGLITVGSDVRKLLSVLEHEIGHEKFEYLKLFDDPVLKAIYEAEKQQCFINFPQIEVNQMAYFFEKGIMGLNETAAESNQIANIIQQWNTVSSRTTFLERYMPKTLAYIQSKMASI